MEWTISFPNAEVVALPAVGSDHSPLVLSLHLVRERRRNEFKFEAYWMEEEECGEIIKSCWEDDRHQQTTLAQKLQ